MATTPDTYKMVTEGIEIKVRPAFISKNNIINQDPVFIWSYYITITNLSDQTVQLIDRHWKIVDEHGGVQQVDGQGVIGKQPVLKPGENFKYSSGVHLNCPSGIMSGHYNMRSEKGEMLQITIPSFSLDSVLSNGIVH